MNRRRQWSLASLCALMLLTASTATAGDGAWGFRLGAADDPDQAVVGVHWSMDGFAREPKLRFVPNLELGFGDDHTVVSVTAPVHYMFRDVDAEFTPYAGGGVILGYIDHDNDNGRGDDEDFEIGLRLTGGLEWQLRKGREFFTELSVIAGDVHDVQVMAGWTFGRR